MDSILEMAFAKKKEKKNAKKEFQFSEIFNLKCFGIHNIAETMEISSAFVPSAKLSMNSS